MTRNSTQISAATALVQLLAEHPKLSEHMTWSITRSKPMLTGFIHDGGMRLLAECAGALGGTVQTEDAYDSNGGRVRPFTLSSVWRDVPVEIRLSLPVLVEAVAS